MSNKAGNLDKVSTIKEERILLQQKEWAFAQFKRMNLFLLSDLGGNNVSRKQKIIKRVDAETIRKGLIKKQERVFREVFLKPALDKFCSTSKYNIKPITEGDSNRVKTKSKQMVFGTNPSADFLLIFQNLTLFKPKSVPAPIGTVGELKYGKLQFRAFVTGLGQLIGYLNMDKFYEHTYRYSFYVFFNTDFGRVVSQTENEFLKDLWERENLFVCII